jgi:hypothetical protein
MSYIKGVRITKSNEPTEESRAFAEYCMELLEYKDGQLIRKVNRGTAKAGDVAGRLRHDGYLYTKIDKLDYAIHQLVFLIHYNYIPKVIDHIDRNKGNNRIGNLRGVTSRENNWNRSDSSEHPCISISSSGKYAVKIYIGSSAGSQRFGVFNTLEEAVIKRDTILADIDNWIMYKPRVPYARGC